MLLPPGYTSTASLKATMKIRTSLGSRARKQTIDELMANGTAVIGSPKTVLEKIERVRDQTGLENLITMLRHAGRACRPQHGAIRERGDAEAARQRLAEFFLPLKEGDWRATFASLKLRATPPPPRPF